MVVFMLYDSGFSAIIFFLYGFEILILVTNTNFRKT